MTDPYYDLIDDFDLIVSSMRSQYGIRLTHEARDMPWSEFTALLSGISPDTALGRIVAIRAETDQDVIRRFTPYQQTVHSDWQRRIAKTRTQEETNAAMEYFKSAFIAMAGVSDV